MLASICSDIIGRVASEHVEVALALFLKLEQAFFVDSHGKLVWDFVWHR